MIKDELGLIHDILNSLGTVTMACEVLGTELPGFRCHPKTAMIDNHITRCLSLISKLRNNLIFQDASYKIKPIYVSEIFQKLELFSKSYNLQTTLKNSTGSETLEVHAHLEMIQRVIDNCIQNGITAGASKVIVECSTYQRIVEFTVKDNGCGMNDEQIKQLGFGYSTTGGGDGSRILLDLVTNAGGTINWNSITDIGTVVAIKLRKANGEDGPHHTLPTNSLPSQQPPHVH